MRCLVRRLQRGDEGFTMVEMLVALTLLAVCLALSMGPLMLGYTVLSRAKLERLATNIAQSQMEEIRTLTYADVGFPSSSPPGILAAVTQVTPSNTNLNFTMRIEVSYEGSASGLNVIPCSTPPCGDGVPGLFNSGVDYKYVKITVTGPTGLTPVVMRTIISPPNIAAHEGLGNIAVHLQKMEPVDAPETPWPNMYVARSTGTPTSYASSTAEEEQIFAGIQPNLTTGELYHVRLNSSVTNGLEQNGWKIHPDDVAAQTERTHVGPAETDQLTVRVYKPATLKVRAKTLLGAAIPSATLYVIQDDRSTAFPASAMSVPGEWNITTLYNEKLIPGQYDLVVVADNYVPVSHAGVSVPAQYPTVMDHVEDFVMNAAATASTSRTVLDAAGRPIRSAAVTFSGGPLATDITLKTGTTGNVTLPLPTGAGITGLAGSPHGHLEQTFAVTGGAANVTLPTPTGYFLLVFKGLSTDPATLKWGYREAGGAPEFAYVFPNSSAPPQPSVALPAGGTTSYQLEKRCSPTSVKATFTLPTQAAGTTYNWDPGSAGTC